jgi:hypothetical protein
MIVNFEHTFYVDGNHEKVVASADAACKEYFGDTPYTFDLWIETRTRLGQGSPAFVKATVNAQTIEDEDVTRQ